MVKVVVVAPTMSFHVIPPSLELCHCTVGEVGDAIALEVKVACVPLRTVISVGCRVTVGSCCT